MLLQWYLSITKADGHPQGVFYKLPDFIMKIFFKLVLTQDDRSVKGDDVTIKESYAHTEI